MTQRVSVKWAVDSPEFSDCIPSTSCQTTCAQEAAIAEMHTSDSSLYWHPCRGEFVHMRR